MVQLSAEMRRWWGEKPAPVFPKWLLGALLLLALVFRLPQLVARPLWYDEAFSVLFSQTGLVGMLRGTLTPGPTGSADIHPLLYYSLLWLWSGLFGTSVFAVRSLSVLISLMVLAALVMLVNRSMSIRAATITGLLFALSPFQIQYAQEARMYGLLSLWLVLGAYLMWHGIHSNAYWPWPAFGVAAALAMYTHVLASVFLVALALSIIIFDRKDLWRRLLLGILVATLVYLPWALQLPGQLTKVATAYWIERPTLTSLIQSVLGFVTGLPLSGIQLGVGLFLSLTSLVFLFLALWKQGVVNPTERRTLLWLGSLVVLPVFLLFGLSQIQPVFILRGLLPSGVMFLSLVGATLSQSRTNPALRGFLAIAMLLAFTLGQWAHFHYAGFPYAPFKEVGEFLREEAGAGEVILHSNKLTMLPQVYYTKDLPQTYLADVPGSGQDTLARSTQEVLGLLAEPNALSAVRDANRVYFLIFAQEIMEYEQSTAGVPPALLWLQTYYDQTSMMEWGDLRLYTFTLDLPQISQR